MGLRDRGTVLDFYIPLFSGVESGRRARFRLQFPTSSYNPYIDNGGTGVPGGIGVGGGGFSDAPDTTISTPSIVSPDNDATGICPTDSIVSSEFASTNAQTHTASRWWIEAVNPAAPSAGAGLFVYDSGPQSANLTALPLSNIGLAPGSSYRVFVRYQGSDGSWSDFSVHSVFTMEVCGVCGAPFDGGLVNTFVLAAGTSYETACDLTPFDNTQLISLYSAANPGGTWTMASGYPIPAAGAAPPKAKLTAVIDGVVTFSPEFDYTACCFEYGASSVFTSAVFWGATRKASADLWLADLVAHGVTATADEEVITKTGGVGFGSVTVRNFTALFGTRACA